MRIAVADDQPDELAWIANVLAEQEHVCSRFSSGEALISALRRETFDLIVVDWNMGRMTGLEVVRWLNESQQATVPIIMLTSRDASDDVVAALEAGATDYITKPADPGIVRARVGAALRRAAPARTGNSQQFGAYRFDRGSGTVSFDDETIGLRLKEFELALLLFENLDRPLARGYLMQRIWNSSPDIETRTLDMHISRIRSKLTLRPERGYALRTVFGFGYRLDSCENGDFGG